MLRLFRKWLKADEAVAAVEAGFVFPILITMLCGVMDIGTGLVANQKVTNASQTLADLLAREESISDAELTDATVAGRLALMPYDTATYGYDIAGVQFIGSDLVPTVQWRDTENMDPNDDILSRSEGLGLEDEGVLAVTIRYEYDPFFSNIILSPIVMEEESYVRGRNGLFVARE